MEILRVRCIKCGKEWYKSASFHWEPTVFSSSLCSSCFKHAISSLIHKRQREEGNFDCFGRAETECDQWMCKYRTWCLRRENTEDMETADMGTAACA